MGKASSSKKVARAAGTGGGRTGGRRRPWSYYGAIALIVVVGVALTWTSRSAYVSRVSGQTAANANAAPKIGGTPWNEAYAVDICGTIQKPLDVAVDKTGITTGGNGVIHVAPKVKSAAGRNATLGAFASSVGIKLSATELGLPGGKVWTSGDTCGGKPGEVFVKQFAFAGAPQGQILRANPRSVRLVDQAMVTVAFVPASQQAAIPAPPASAQKALQATAPVTPPPTTSPTVTVPAKVAPTTTVPAKAKGKSGKTSTTTVKPASPPTT